MELPIVTQLRDLAQDPANRVSIVSDQGCLPGLVLFLDNDETAVIDTAVEALELLSRCAENRDTMRDELGLVISLDAIVKRNDIEESTKSLAKMTLAAICASRDNDPMTPDGMVAPSQANTECRKFFVGSINHTARTVTLQINGLVDQESRSTVEELLLEVRGVVSFTFDMPQQRCVIRARKEVDVEMLCSAIEKSKIMTAQQIVRGEGGRETVLSFGEQPSTVQGGAGGHIPCYLDDDDEDLEPVDGKAVARTAPDGYGGGWFNTLGTYISSSLYW
eukprot:m.104133 g.104133  ORF g.104133 m.104133 type:complete len:277 (-) comp15624_c0_seq1:155-985(-)